MLDLCSNPLNFQHDWVAELKEKEIAIYGSDNAYVKPIPQREKNGINIRSAVG